MTKLLSKLHTTTPASTTNIYHDESWHCPPASVTSLLIQRKLKAFGLHLIFIIINLLQTPQVVDNLHHLTSRELFMTKVDARFNQGVVLRTVQQLGPHVLPIPSSSTDKYLIIIIAQSRLLFRYPFAIVCASRPRFAQTLSQSYKCKICPSWVSYAEPAVPGRRPDIYAWHFS